MPVVVQIVVSVQGVYIAMRIIVAEAMKKESKEEIMRGQRAVCKQKERFRGIRIVGYVSVQERSPDEVRTVFGDDVTSRVGVKERYVADGDWRRLVVMVMVMRHAALRVTKQKVNAFFFLVPSCGTREHSTERRGDFGFVACIGERVRD